MANPFANTNSANPFAGMQGGNPFAPRAVDPNTFSSGVGRGVEQFQSNLYSAAEAIGEATDWEGLAEWGKEGRITNLEEAAKYGAPIEFKDAEALGDYVSWATTSAGSLLADTAAYLTAAGTGFLVGGPVGAGVGVAAVSAPLNVGAVQSRIKEVGGEEATLGAGGAALAGGLTALDTVGISKLASPFFKETVKKMVEKEGADKVQAELEKGLVSSGVSASVAQEAAKATVLSSGMATTSTALLEAGAHSVADVDIDYDDFYNRMKESAALGVLGGAPLGSVSGYIKHKNLKNVVMPEAPQSFQKERSLGVLGGLHDWFTGQITSSIAPKATRAAAGQDLVRIFNDPLGDDLTGVQSKLRNEINYDREQVYKQAQKEYGKGWEDKLVEDYTAGKDSGSAKALRDHLANLADRGVKAKLLPESRIVEDYIPSRMDVDNIKNNLDEFKSDLRSQLAERGRTPDEATLNAQVDRYVEQLETGDFSKLTSAITKLEGGEDLTKLEASMIDKVTGGEVRGGELGSTRVGNISGNLEGQRRWNVGQDFYNKWSVGENKGRFALESIADYGEGVAHRIAGADMLGKNGEKLNRLILETQAELAGSGNPTLTANEVSTFYDMVDAYDNTYRTIQNPTARKISTVAKTGSTMAALPLVTLGSLTEIFNVAMRTDMSSMVQSTLSVMNRAGVNLVRRAMLRGPSESWQTNATQMSMAGQSINTADSLMMARLADPNIGTRAAKVTRGFFKMTGLSYWTHFVREVGAEATRLQVTKDLDLVNNAKFQGSGEAMRANQRLTELGIVGQARDALLPNSGAPQAVKNKAMADAIYQFNRKVAPSPTFSDRPLWMSNQHLWLFSQLQSYPTIFTNSVLPLLGNKLKSAPSDVIDGLFILGGIALVGSMQISLRDAVSGRELDRDPTELVMSSIFRYVTPRSIQAFGEAINSHEYGDSPHSSFFGVGAHMASDMVSLTSQNAAKLASGEMDLSQYLADMAFASVGTSARGWRDELGL